MPPAGFCNNCGRQLVNDEATCPTCGAVSTAPRGVDLPTAAVPVIPGGRAEGPASVRRRTRSLEVIRGRNAGALFLIDDRRLVIGRTADAAIFLDDITVSRHHAEVFEGESRAVWVRDLGSMNGTYLNGEQVAVGQLLDGDILQIGMFKLRFAAGTS